MWPCWYHHEGYRAKSRRVSAFKHNDLGTRRPKKGRSQTGLTSKTIVLIIPEATREVIETISNLAQSVKKANGEGIKGVIFIGINQPEETIGTLSSVFPRVR